MANDKTLIVSDAQPEEQGSFCDTDSRYTYQNVDGFTKEVKIREAEENGVDPLLIDEPLWGVGPAKDVNQRHNITQVEHDDQGNWFAPKHGPGK